MTLEDPDTRTTLRTRTKQPKISSWIEVEEKTKLLGEVMPRVLGGTITPKQHWLVHHPGPFARRWRTIGLFREEGMDNLL